MIDGGDIPQYSGMFERQGVIVELNRICIKKIESCPICKTDMVHLGKNVYCCDGCGREWEKVKEDEEK